MLGHASLLQHPGKDGGHGIPATDAGLAHKLHKKTRHPHDVVGNQHSGCAAQGHIEDIEGGKIEAQRRGAGDAVAGDDLKLACGPANEGAHCPVRKLDALGLPRGTGGEEDEGRILGRHLRQRRRIVFLRCWRRPCNAGSSVQIGDARWSAVAIDQQPRSALGQNRVDALPRPARMNGDIDGSGQQRGKDGNDGFGVLGQEPGRCGRRVEFRVRRRRRASDWACAKSSAKVVIRSSSTMATASGVAAALCRSHSCSRFGSGQARASVTPQVKPMPAEANSSNWPGRMSPSRRISA